VGQPPISDELNGFTTLYHGTDIGSATDILENGLNMSKAAELGGGDALWTTTSSSDAGWFAASNHVGGDPAVLQITVPNATINDLSGSGMLSVEGSVYRFQPGAMNILNGSAKHQLGEGTMNRVKFPRRNDDGSFCVEIGLKLAGDHQEDLGSRIQRWIEEHWMPNRSIWRRVWRTGHNLSATDEQILHYDDEFLKPPEVISSKRPELRLRLFGKESAKLWRDWLIWRLVPDLKAQFPEIGSRLYIRNCHVGD
jgi:hypothetical protein